MQLKFQTTVPGYKDLKPLSKTFETDHVYRLKPGQEAAALEAIKHNGGDDVVFKLNGDTYVATGRNLSDHTVLAYPNEGNFANMPDEFRNYPTAYKLQGSLQGLPNPQDLVQKGDTVYRQGGEVYIAARGSHRYDEVGERMASSPLKATLNGKSVEVIAVDEEIQGAKDGAKSWIRGSSRGGDLGFALGWVTSPLGGLYGLIKSALPFKPDAIEPYAEKVSSL